jgi:hypothetical protein
MAYISGMNERLMPYPVYSVLVAGTCTSTCTRSSRAVSALLAVPGIVHLLLLVQVLVPCTRTRDLYKYKAFRCSRYQGEQAAES